MASGVQERTFLSHSATVRSIALSADQRLLLSGSFDRTVHLMDVDSGNVLKKFEDGFCAAVALTPDAPLAAHGAGSRIHIWNTDTGKTVLRIERAGDAINALAFVPGGKLLVSGDSSGVLQVWEVDSGRQVHRLTQHADQAGRFPNHKPGVFSLRCFPDGRHFASGGHDKTLRIFELASGREVARAECEHYSTSAIAISPDGQTIASGGGIVTLNDLKTNVQDGDYAIRLWKVPEMSGPQKHD
jgi:WD40 repeat protein